jgi:hypothetical protein
VPTVESLPKPLNDMSGYEINYSQETFRLYLKNIGISYRHLEKTLRIMEIPHLKKSKKI